MVMASLGQTSTHAAQSLHNSSSTTAKPSSVNVMASVGHASTHSPQPAQSSGSTFAAKILPFRLSGQKIQYYRFGLARRIATLSTPGIILEKEMQFYLLLKNL